MVVDLAKNGFLAHFVIFGRTCSAQIQAKGICFKYVWTHSRQIRGKAIVSNMFWSLFKNSHSEQTNKRKSQFRAAILD